MFNTYTAINRISIITKLNVEKNSCRSKIKLKKQTQNNIFTKEIQEIFLLYLFLNIFTNKGIRKAGGKYTNTPVKGKTIIIEIVKRVG